MGGDERRREPRAPLMLMVEYDGIDALIGDYTENLSQGGTFVATNQILPIGTDVELQLSFPGLLEPVTVHGVVRWTQHEEPMGIGIEFLQSPKNDKAHALLARIVQRAPEIQARVIRLLVADDNPHIEALVREGLKSAASREYGHRLQFELAAAADGKQALALVAEGTYDVAIIDVYLPIVDGAQVIAALRAKFGTNVAIVAISGAGKNARRDALGAGANVFVDKPMRLQHLLDTIQTLLGSGAV